LREVGGEVHIRGHVKRLPFIDWTRGFAVVAMVLWHTGDAWLRPGLKDGQGFFLLRFVGGLAAPSFLFLAGLGAALATRPAADPLAARLALRAGLGRGLEIVVIGYALRLQSWLVDAQALVSLRCAGAYLPLGLGYGLAFLGARRLTRSAPLPRSALLYALACATLIGAGLAQVPWLAPTRLTRLLQVDVLQCIGASLCLLAALQHTLGISRSPLRASALGLFVAALTEPLAALLAGSAPQALVAYVVRQPLVDGVQPALFPLFPWLAYACFGAAFGALLARAPAPGALVTAAAPLGALLGLCTSEAQPFVHRLIRDQPWSVGPIRVGFRCAIVLGVLLVGYAWTRSSARRSVARLEPITLLGRHSMRIYWAHMLFAYGVFGRMVQHELGYRAWAALAALLLALMALVARLELPGRRPLPPHDPPSSDLSRARTESISLSPDTK
jgi:Heparan-alpha-glucosaminide N-acetyltransferase, catalytic